MVTYSKNISSLSKTFTKRFSVEHSGIPQPHPMGHSGKWPWKEAGSHSLTSLPTTTLSMIARSERSSKLLQHHQSAGQILAKNLGFTPLRPSRAGEKICTGSRFLRQKVRKNTPKVNFFDKCVKVPKYSGKKSLKILEYTNKNPEKILLGRICKIWTHTQNLERKKILKILKQFGET